MRKPTAALLLIALLQGCTTGDLLPGGAVARMGTPRFHHSGGIRSLAFSPDGERLASCGFQRTAIWDFTSGQELFHLPSARHVAFAPSGTVLATADDAGVIRIHDAATGTNLLECRADTTLNAIAFSPGGEWLAAGGVDHLGVFDVETGAQRSEFVGQRHNVCCLMFSPDGGMLATAGVDAKVRLWNSRTGKLMRELDNFPYPIGSIAFSPDGSRLAVGGLSSNRMDSAICVWDTGSGRVRKHMAPLQKAGSGFYVYSICHLRFLPDGNRIITTGFAGVRIWDVRTGEAVETITADNDHEAFALSPAGRFAAVGRYHGFRIFELATGRERFPDRHRGPVGSLTISSDGKLVASTSSGYWAPIRVWNAATGEPLGTIGTNAWSVAFRPGHRELMATTEMGQRVQVFDPTTGAKLRELELENLGYYGLSFSGDGSRLAVADQYGRVAMVEPDSGITIRRFATAQPAFRAPSVLMPRDAMALARSGGAVAASSDYCATSVWNTNSAALLCRLPRTETVTAIALSPDGTVLATAAERIELRDVTTGKLLRFMQHDNRTTAVAFSPDGRHLASSSFDKTVRIWRVETGEELRVFRGHADEVATVRYSADGSRVVSGGHDGWVFVWDATKAR